MGRTIEFDVEQALLKAMNLFWKKGYQGASLKELLAEMKILNGSFYHHFKDKESLYIQVLKFYRKKISEPRGALILASPSLKLGLRAFFNEIFRHVEDPQTPKGCLLANSLQGDVSTRVHRVVLQEVENIENFFQQQLSAAQQRGEIAEGGDLAAMASILLIHTQGLLRLSNLDYSMEKLRRQTELLLSSLGL